MRRLKGRTRLWKGPPAQARRAFDERAARVGYLRTIVSKLLAPLKFPFMLGFICHSAI